MSKILIVDDHPLFLDGLREFLNSDETYEIICAKSAEEAHKLRSQHDFDLLLLDVSIKGGGGLGILKEVRESESQVPVVFLTVHITAEETIQAMRMGLNGVILKEREPARIMNCVKTVLGGDTYFDQIVTEQALHHSVESNSNAASTTDTLTMREREIVKLVAEGLRNLEIAQRCKLTEGTVKTHLHNIFTKMGVKSRTQLLIALDQGKSDNINL